MIPIFDADRARKAPGGMQLRHALVLVSTVPTPMCEPRPATPFLGYLSTDWRIINCTQCQAIGSAAEASPDTYTEYIVGGPHHGETVPDRIDTSSGRVKLWKMPRAFAHTPEQPTVITEHTYELRTLVLFGEPVKAWVEHGYSDLLARTRLLHILLAPHRRPAPKGPGRV